MHYYYNYNYYYCYHLVCISACEISVHHVITLGLRSYYLDIRTQKSAKVLHEIKTHCTQQLKGQ